MYVSKYSKKLTVERALSCSLREVIALSVALAFLCFPSDFQRRAAPG